MLPTGYLAIVLHAHLPFVRHPEHARHLEERWLYEALIECYLPLLDAFDRMAETGIPFALTMSLTPPLAAMLNDDLLRTRFDDHLRRLQSLTDREIDRLASSWDGARFAPVAHFYREELARVRGVWDRHRGDVVAGLVRHWDAGRLELIACSATHCYLPGLLPAREGIRPQIELGMSGFERLVGRRPLGMWLPECAFHPTLDHDLARAGVRFTVVDTHAITNANPRPPFGVHAPIVSPHGVAYFGRDHESSRQVWSRDEGYPGDSSYRDFYRDIGFDLPAAALMGEVAADGSRLMTGLKYFRITGQGADKQPYAPSVARDRAWEHAGNFVWNRANQAGHLAQSTATPPVIVSPYDAELFGHWWFEGPMFLEACFRRLPEAGGAIEAVTLRGLLERHPVAVESTPAASSWGAGGFGEVWVGAEAAWTWRHVHHATRYVAWLVREHRESRGARGEALDQCIRELLLLQSSDWAFILKTGTATRYAEARFRAHVHRLRHLGHLVESGLPDAPDDLAPPHHDHPAPLNSSIGADPAWVADLRARDNFLCTMHGDELRRPFD